MDRDIKIFNRPVMSKIHKKNQELHLQRLKNIKVTISSYDRVEIVTEIAIILINIQFLIRNQFY